jgi:hypothetical protein
MTDNLEKGRYFGRGGVRTLFAIGVTLLAGILELLSLVTARKLASLFYVPAEAYLAPIVLPLPWFAGLIWWRRVRRALRDGAISQSVAEFCYGAIIQTLSAAYGVLCYFEVTLVMHFILVR